MIFRKTYSESELIEGIQEGGVKRERCSDILFQKHRNLVHRARRRFSLSEEEAQEVYIDAISIVCRQIENGSFRQESKLSTYLFSVFDNKCKNKLRDRKRTQHQWIEDMPDLPSRARDMLEEMVQQEELLEAESLLDQLGGKCKEILILSEYQGYSQQEIADQLGLKSPRVVASSRYRCILKLKKILAGKKASLSCEFSSTLKD